MNRQDFGSAGSSNSKQDDVQMESKKRPPYRHNQFQTKILESFFKDVPHPNEAQKNQLATQLGLDAKQVTFWFQNRRTQRKIKQEHGLNTELRNENERIKTENQILKKNLLNASCFSCKKASDIGKLLVENNGLRVKVDQLKMEAECLGKPLVTVAEDTTPVSPYFSFEKEELIRLGAHPICESKNQKISELAVDATNELMKMTQKNGTLWIPDIFHNQNILNEEEYYRTIFLGARLGFEGFISETSREFTTVMADANSLVGLLMDVNIWSTTFSEIVARATSIKTLSIGEEGNNNGALNVIVAELQALSPFVPTRTVYFVRCCKHLGDGTWIVTDASLDLFSDHSLNARRRPSGCLIQELSNGCSEVTWVEHFDVPGSRINFVKPNLNFGAKRWVSILARQCQRQRSAIMITPEEYPSTGGRWNLYLLAERLVIDFCGSLHASRGWQDIPGIGADDVRLMVQKCIGYPGRLSGIVVKALTSFHLPCSPSKVLEFLSDAHSRNVWDVVFYGGSVQEMAKINTGQGSGNCISVLQSVGGINNKTMVIQETRKDSTGSLLVFAPIDFSSMDMLLSGADNLNAITLLPSGFSILPDDSAGDGVDFMVEDGYRRSLITVTYQILADEDPINTLPLESVGLANQLVIRTVNQLKLNLGIS